MNRWHWLFLFTLLFGSSWVWFSRVPVTAQPLPRAAQPAVGYPAPDFTLKTLQGEEFSLAAQRGKPVVLNFWATWCGPCQRELPTLQAASQSHAGEVVIVGVDQGETAEIVQRYVKQKGLTFPIPLDPELTVGSLYNIRGMPTTFFIDANGIIQRFWLGEMNSITLAEGIALID